MKNRWFLVFIVLLPGYLSGQDHTSLKKLQLWPVQDTMVLDSLSVIPGSVKILSLGQELADSCYEIDYVNAVLHLKTDPGIFSDTLLVEFRTYGLRLNKVYRYLEPGKNRINPVKTNSLLSSAGRRRSWAGEPAGAQLFTTGDLSRGVQLGNNQDASLNSSLNLKITGRINESFSIEAQLSDANIPLQPEGNTAQLQEFDRLSIRLYSSRSEILAGDFTLSSPQGYFQRFNKNLQGIQFSTTIPTGKSGENELTTQSTAAVVKGKFNRMKFNGTEGNQGPYRLTGSEGEQYIQVIAGSEQVFIDGVPLQRGEYEDYTINYNTAELSFTPKNLITRDKRITVQFEYTDRSYARFVLATENVWKTNKGSWYLNLFNETDARNQTLLQDLTADQKNLLSLIGDDLDRAVVQNFYESGFSNDRVLYLKTDTLVNGEEFQNILIYSTNPELAIYQAGFSYVGENQGNYRPIQSSANGQVYEWVAPQNGVSQGSYEPVSRLVTPKSKQMYTLGGDARVTPRMIAKAELTVTSFNQNTFSSLDNEDNTGTGISSEIIRKDPLKPDSSLMLNTFIRYRRTGKQFSAVEPFREVEFERDWNLGPAGMTETENFLQTGFRLDGSDSLQAGYQFEYLHYGPDYQANRHLTSGSVSMGQNELSWTGSLLNSDNIFRTSTFARHRVELSRDFNVFRISLTENAESNRWNQPESSILEEGSFKFQEYSARISATIQAVNPWFVEIKQRSDFLPDSSGFIRSYDALEQTAGINLKGPKGHSTRLSLNYRRLSALAESLQQSPEKTMTFRGEEQVSIWKGLLRSGTFYEIGSGLERKQEFYYLEVPAGQGYYTWSDYNGNNIRELDEFEAAVFSDQAAYIRVFRPGTSYFPVYSNRFTQTLSLQPAAVIKEPASKLSWLKLFRNQFSYDLNRRNQKTDLLAIANPFMLDEALLVSLQSRLRNQLSFNTANRKFGVDYTIQESANRVLMNYGTDQRSGASHGMMLRLRLWDPLWLNNEAEMGTNGFRSEFFTNRNYDLGYWKNTFSLSLDLSDQARLNLEWITGDEQNLSGEESCTQQQVELGADYQIPGKGLIHLDLNYLYFDFAGEANTPVGYVMLKGFRPGHNGMANFNFRRKINDLIQLDLSYGLRVSQSSQWIHTGNIAVRAVF